MRNEQKLSNKSKAFLENLSIYLFSTGKNAEETHEIVKELEDHLIEAERNGKPIEKIIGKSPKEYMEMISKEMSIDYRSWFQYIVVIVFGLFSIMIFMDLLEGNLSYSILEIAGTIVIAGVFIISILTVFKYISASSLSFKKQRLILVGLVALPLVLQLVLIYLNRFIETPIIHFSNTGSFIIGIIAAIILIGISIWSKTWILIVLMALLTLPTYLLSLTSLNHETQLTISALITFGGIAIYLGFQIRKT